MCPKGLDRGYVQVYTGDGKGKTTAALGLALRAVGRGLSVLMIQFMKHWGYGEHLAARRLEPELRIVQVGKPYLIAREEDLDEEAREALGDEIVVFPPGEPPDEVVRLAREGVRLARRALEADEVDLLILDEINVAVHYDLIGVDEVLDLIDARPESMELVLTGRCAPTEVVERADLVTEMKEIKHYYRQGVMARRGIEE
ncbi:MAG: cob(I)yrinic acid a,c-diamide adenosyltransferase [Bacillota bacterium]